MNPLSLQPQIKAADVPLNELAANPHIPDSEKVAEVSRQFEAVLLRQILQEARKSGLPRLVSGALLALAEAQLEDGDSARARETALAARGQFAQAGQAESEARAALIAARAAHSTGDAAGAQQLAASAAHSFAAFYGTWPPEARASYDARPDVRHWRSQLTRLMAEPTHQ